MIAYVQGILVEKTPTYAVIDCGGVGYMLHISLNTYSSLPDINKECKLLTHLSIKEDAHTLHAFYTSAEKQLFRLLISVSGIGTNTARLILSSMSPTEVASHISSGNAAMLQTVKGVGAKTVQRIIIELKDKIIKTELEISDTLTNFNNNNVEEALSALILLGFSKQVATKAIDGIIKKSTTTLSVEELIKQTLKIL